MKLRYTSSDAATFSGKNEGFEYDETTFNGKLTINLSICYVRLDSFKSILLNRHFYYHFLIGIIGKILNMLWALVSKKLDNVLSSESAYH